MALGTQTAQAKVAVWTDTNNYSSRVAGAKGFRSGFFVSQYGHHEGGKEIPEFPTFLSAAFLGDKIRSERKGASIPYAFTLT
jgi:hypothetical protein